MKADIDKLCLGHALVIEKIRQPETRNGWVAEHAALRLRCRNLDCWSHRREVLAEHEEKPTHAHPTTG